MDDQHLKDLNPGGVSGAVRCLICLNPFRGQPVASPQPCDHVYCLACITEWAKISNSCPVDRLKFAVLYQRSCVGGDIKKIIAVEPNDGQGLVDEGRSEELSVCEECGRSDRRHLMLLCFACDSRFHIACIHPPLATVPVEDWFCQECAPEDRFSREESKITDDEMTEMLAEVVQTSTFLRPSTTAQRAGSDHTRRSQRARQQSSRTHTIQPQTVQHVPRYLLKSNCSYSEDATTSNLVVNTPKEDKKVTVRKKRRWNAGVQDSV